MSLTRSARSFAVAVAAAVARAAPAAANGIFTTPEGNAPVARSQVRLKSHRVTATIRDGVADVTVEQTFHSDAAAQLEGTYLFPLPKGAAVAKFAMTMGGRMVAGEVVEAKQARRVYEEIVSRRRDPGLLEYVGGGLFRARVFPIEPRADLTIRLSFQEVLAEDAGTLEWRYPLSTDRLNGAPVEDVLVDAKIESTVDLKAVYCPSHAASVVRDGERKARVTHERAGRRQDRDFVLYVGRSPEDVGFSLVSGKGVAEDGTFMAVLAPRVQVAEGKRIAKDVVYVLDTSGSMAGEKIEQARASLAYGVRILHDGDRFAVLSFSTGVRSFRDGLVEATRETKEAAVAWIGALQAEGGTNIEEALVAALKVRAPDRSPLVVFVTDGRPTVGETAPEALLRRVSDANAGKARVFTFGVGFDLDVRLLDRIAEQNGGTRDYVPPQQDIEVVTGRFFRKVESPVLRDVSVEFGGGVYDVYPAKVPDLFAGEQVVLFGRYHDVGERTVRLKGKVSGQEVWFSHAARFASEPGPDFLARLWAHRKVAFLLDEIRLRGTNPELVTEVTRLGTKYAIVTPYTSGLVLEEETERVHATDLVAREPVIRDAEISDHYETSSDLPFEESFGGGGLSDAPFEGPAHNGAISLGGGAGGAFAGRGGHRNLRAGGGGGKKTDDALEHDLRWLAAHQSADGGWSAAAWDRWCDRAPTSGGQEGLGKASHDVGVTGLALLAYLGAGYTNRGEHPFARTVGDGLHYLRNVQDAEGCFGPRASDSYACDHAVAALAMVEYCGMTGSSLYRSPAQKALDFLRIARDDVQGTEARAWAAAALHGARLVNAADVRVGRSPSLRFDPADLDAALDWASRARAAGDATAGAVEILLRAWRGEEVATRAELRPAIEGLVANLPAWRQDGAGMDLALWHWRTLAAFQVGREAWSKWNEAMKTAIVDSQRLDGDSCSLKGSWDPLGANMAGLGRVGSTATLAMCLEVYYRYDRAFGTGVAPTAPAPAAMSEEERRARESVALRRAQEAATAPADARGLRTVAGRTFRRDDEGRWVETAWDGKSATERVEAYSEAYFALVQASDDVARILALSDRVVFLSGGKAIEIVPPAPAANTPK